MKIVCLPLLAASLLATTVQDGYAWAPSTLSSRATTKTATPNRRNQGMHYVPQLPNSYTSPPLYATVEERQVTSSNSANEDASTVKAILDRAPTKILGGAIPYSELSIGVLKETYPGENRVSQTPDSVKNLVKAGFTVIVQSGGT